MTAGVSTLAIFAALTGIVLVTKKDFSWLRSTMILGLFVAIGAMIAAVAFGLTFGLGLTIFFIFIAAASILYGTSNVLHHYHPEAYVAASLSLFSSVVLLFMQLLRLFSRE
jgi:FtsH-binding integral membrane protein